ncbi:Secoisolariciresinol dehydrogenase [Nymphaea thermarum]|nr:Secoisolariciresinol dehydrogenase [Nymphaea thermarum]
MFQVTNEEDSNGAVDGTVAKYGKLHIMYKKAGLRRSAGPKRAGHWQVLIEKLLSVHIVGGFRGAKHSARVMVPARQGSIIFSAIVASVLGGLGLPTYCASRLAIAGFCKSMAVDLGHFGIRVDCVSPYEFTPIISGFSNMNES